ncbi:MAG TPA: alpha/beta hydrolase domain-containing protein, partial [Bryobacteraceae bacterium]|nr:alpha/beta hydrolase domain-containing protein [Bryobacteraceae bacterium]
AVEAARRLIPHAEWKFVDSSHVTLQGGFTPGRIYEVVYETKDPPVAGLGLAGIRDFISFLKYGGAATDLDIGTLPIRHAIAFGVSQSGRFLREYLYDGFNEDEQGRKVFDGVWAHVAGAGRGSFNQRFAQPSRDGHEFANVFYPVDVPPFDEESLLQRSHEEHAVPKLFLTNGSYEYWSRCASLIHTTADGRADAAPSDNSRIYFFAGSQHTVGIIPDQGIVERELNVGQNLQNVNDYRYSLRALLLAMQGWITSDTPPPPSQYPRLTKGELTPLAGLHFPHIEGVNIPRHKREAYRLDFSTEPPNVGDAFPTFVPQVDGSGNDEGGIEMPEIAVPLASYTGWNLRNPVIGAPGDLLSFLGSWIPFPVNEVEQKRREDPRVPVDQRYPNEQDYLNRIDQAGRELLRRGFLLQDDLPALHHRASQEWEFYQLQKH